MEQNPNNQDQLMTKKCPMCGKEYPKKQKYCEKCNALLMRKKDYEHFEMDKYSVPTQNAIQKLENEQNTITCPYCKSTDVSKISTFGRAASVGIFGLVSKKIGKQWHCNHCKSDF